MGVASSTRKRHLGIEFVIWNRGSAWFWFLTRPCGKSGSIGATTSQTRAMREACWSIEAICKLQKPYNDTGFSTERNGNPMKEDDEPFRGPSFHAAISDP